MTRASCSAAAEQALAKVAGVTRVAVDLEAEEAAVQTLAGVSIDEPIAAVKRVGFEAEPATREKSSTKALKTHHVPRWVESWPCPDGNV